MSKLDQKTSEEIKDQVENHVVMYNMKANDAFFIMTPAEARYAVEQVKKFRQRDTEGVTFPTLKEQKWFKKSRANPDLKNNVILYQQVANAWQIFVRDKNYYQECCNVRRGAVSSVSAHRLMQLRKEIEEEDHKSSTD